MFHFDFTTIFASLGPVLFGIAVLVAQHILGGRRDLLREDPINFLLSLLGWILIGVGLFGPLMGNWIMVISLIPIILFILIDVLRRYWASQQHALLGLLAVAAERSMPLAPAVEAFARERLRGPFGRKAMRLAELLRLGYSLPDALVYCGGLVPVYSLATIRVWSASGALAPALRQSAARENMSGTQTAALTGKIWYLALLLFFGYGIFSFIMWKILPQYEKIFHGFGIKTLPPMTQWVYNLGALIYNNPVCGLFSLLLNLVLPCLLLFAVIRYFGWIPWDPPGVSRLMRRLDAANALDALALVAGQQRPLPDGITALAWEYPKWNIRRGLRGAAADIQDGCDWAESLRRHRLIGRADLAILQSAQRADNLVWALHELADGNRRRFAYRLQAIVQFAYPPVILLFGLVVACIVIGLFIPLIALIQKLA